MRECFAILAAGLALVGCASTPRTFARLPVVSLDECAVISAYVRRLPTHQKTPGGSADETFLSIAHGGIQLNTTDTRLSSETLADARVKFGHSARLDECAELQTQAADAGWRFAPRVPRNLGDKGSYRSVDRVGLNGDRTEAVLRATTGGSYGGGRFAWFDVETLLFRKDTRTGEWREVVELEGVST